MSIDIKSLINQYEFTCVLPSTGEEVKFKPLTTGQMKKLLVYENNEDPFVIEDIIDDIIRGCVLEDGFDVGKLKLQDRFKLLLDIRIKSKGAKYTFMFKCPECEIETLQSTNLNKLKNNPFDKNRKCLVTLNDSISLNLGYITRDIQKRAQKMVKQIPDLTYTQQLMETVTYSMAMSVSSVLVNGEEVKDTSLEDLVFVMDNASDSEFEKIKKWYEDGDFGVEFKYTQKCKSCKFTREVDLPMSNFFV